MMITVVASFSPGAAQMISVQAETIARTNKIAVKGLMNALQSLLKRDSFLPWVKRLQANIKEKDLRLSAEVL